MKLGFLVYLFHPKTMGASTVYENYILPYVEEYESKVNQALNDAKTKAKDMYKDVTSKSD